MMVPAGLGAAGRGGGAMAVAGEMLRAEGPRAFFKGVTPRLLHKIPANGLFFLWYEVFRTLLGVQPLAPGS